MLSIDDIIAAFEEKRAGKKTFQQPNRLAQLLYKPAQLLFASSQLLSIKSNQLSLYYAVQAQNRGCNYLSAACQAHLSTNNGLITPTQVISPLLLLLTLLLSSLSQLL
jgi:hypothetical protein